MKASSIRCVNLSVSRGSQFSLRDINFNLPTGLLALFGHNGSGKTTLLRALAGHLSLDEGKIYIGDKCLNGLSAAQRRKTGLLYLPQAPIWVPDLCPSRYLHCAMTQRGHKELSDIAADTDFPIDVLSDILRNDQIQSLSIMIRRAIELFRAAATDATVVLLDEPLAGFDSTYYQLMFNYIKSLATKKAVIMVEHSPEFRTWASTTSAPALYLQDGLTISGVESVL